MKAMVLERPGAPLRLVESSDLRPANGEVRVDVADDFVTGHDGKFRIRQFAINDVQVGAAHPTRRNTNSDFADCRPRIGLFHGSERRARPFQNHCLHVSKCIAPLARGKAAPRIGVAVS